MVLSVQPPPTFGERVAGFFAWCGGAKAELIREFPEERTRLATIGATVLFTGLFAGASSSYAIRTVFDEGWWVTAATNDVAQRRRRRRTADLRAILTTTASASA